MNVEGMLAASQDTAPTRHDGSGQAAGPVSCRYKAKLLQPKFAEVSAAAPSERLLSQGSSLVLALNNQIHLDESRGFLERGKRSGGENGDRKTCQRPLKR